MIFLYIYFAFSFFNAFLLGYYKFEIVKSISVFLIQNDVEGKDQIFSNMDTFYFIFGVIGIIMSGLSTYSIIKMIKNG